MSTIRSLRGDGARYPCSCRLDPVVGWSLLDFLESSWEVRIDSDILVTCQKCELGDLRYRNSIGKSSIILILQTSMCFAPLVQPTAIFPKHMSLIVQGRTARASEQLANVVTHGGGFWHLEFEHVSALQKTRSTSLSSVKFLVLVKRDIPFGLSFMIQSSVVLLSHAGQSSCTTVWTSVT